MWDPFANPDSIDRIAEAVQKAPSAFNVQPWSLRICADDRIELRANLGQHDKVNRGRWDRWLNSKGTNYPDPLAREFAISCGAALFNLRLAIRVAGHDLSVHLLPDLERDSTLLASVEIDTKQIKKPARWEQDLYEAIGRHHTIRWPYIIPAPMPVIADMEHAANAASQGRSQLRLLSRKEAKEWIRVVAATDQDLASAPVSPRAKLYQDQRRRWTGKSSGKVGVPADNFGPTPKRRWLIWRYPLTRNDFWLGEKRRFERKPQLMALSTADDRPLDWLLCRPSAAVRHPDRNPVFGVGSVWPGRAVRRAVQVRCAGATSPPEA